MRPEDGLWEREELPDDGRQVPSLAVQVWYRHFRRTGCQYGGGEWGDQVGVGAQDAI